MMPVMDVVGSSLDCCADILRGARAANLDDWNDTGHGGRWHPQNDVVQLARIVGQGRSKSLRRIGGDLHNVVGTCVGTVQVMMPDEICLTQDKESSMQANLRQDYAG